MSQLPNPSLPINQAFADLIFFALEHGIDSVAEGGPLVPFLIYEQNGKRVAKRYLAQPYEESVRQARIAAAALPSSVCMCALAYDGSVIMEDVQSDAIIVEAAEQGQNHGVKFAQRYRPKKLLSRFRTIGNPLYLGESDSILKVTP